MTSSLAYDRLPVAASGVLSAADGVRTARGESPDASNPSRQEEQTDFDVIIVGGGPAGASAAIQLATRGCAGRTLLLDRAVFPREKLCGGGVVRQADRLLGYLGVHVDVPSVPIHAARFDFPGGHSFRRAPAMFRVVRREEFDHALLREAEQRGVTVRQGEPVSSLRRRDGGVVVSTAGADYTTRVVIGADGANGLVRRSLIQGRRPGRFVALEVLTPMDGSAREAESVDANTAVFDFRPTTRGLRGYYWDFPSVRGGEGLMNRGIGGSTWADGASPKELFAEQLHHREIDLERCDLQGATAPLYDPSVPQSAPHALLAGDAVGIDPWFGEGISTAIGTGMLAAHAAADGLASGDFAFADFRVRVRNSAIGSVLRRQRASARAFYRAADHPFGLVPWFGISQVRS